MRLCFWSESTPCQSGERQKIYTNFLKWRKAIMGQNKKQADKQLFAKENFVKCLSGYLGFGMLCLIPLEFPPLLISRNASKLPINKRKYPRNSPVSSITRL